MKFIEGNKNIELSNEEILKVINKHSIKDINKDDLQLLINKEIYPIINRDERESLLEGTLSFWINDNFTFATLVGFVNSKDAGMESARSKLREASDKFGCLYLEEW